MTEDLFGKRHSDLLAAYHREKADWESEKQDLLKQIAEERTRREALEKSARYRTITLDTIVRDPVLSIKANNTLRYVNAAYVALTGFPEAECIGKQITEVAQGLEFLTQFHEHPELIAVESSATLREAPVVLFVNGEQPLQMIADVGFSPGETAGYNGATIIFRQKTDERWYTKFTRFFTNPWFSRWHVVIAKEYADEGIIHIPEKTSPAETDRGRLFLQEITREVMKHTHRGVAVDLKDISSCDQKVYEALLSIAKIKECPFTCFVDEDSSVFRGLQEASFPRECLKIVKKKK